MSNLGHLTGSWGPHPMNRCVPRKPSLEAMIAEEQRKANPLDVNTAPSISDNLPSRFKVYIWNENGLCEVVECPPPNQP